MKIFFDCTYLRNKHTGVDVYFFNLIHHLLQIDDKNEYTILVDSRYNTSYLLNEVKGFHNYKIIRVYSPLPLQVLYSSFFISFFLRFNKFDIYHNPYFFGPLLNFICSKTKIVITVHDLYHRTVPEMMNKQLNIIFKFFADNAIKKADEVIVISNQTKSDVLKYLKIAETKLNLIHQALDNKFELNPVENYYSDKFGLKENKYIFSVGKILPSKGFDDLIKAFEILVNQYNRHDIILVIAGMHVGQYVSQIEKLIESLQIKQGSVKLLGYVTNDDIFSLYGNANMVVSPSHYEGFGFTVLEGMKFGKPVIARNASSLIEIVGEAGLLFNSVNELADAMNQLLSDNDLRNVLIARGFERIRDFSWIETAKKSLAVYSKH